MAFYERECAVGGFVHPIPKKLILHRHSNIPAKLEETLKL
jgi:hypothetical protein